MGPTGFDFKGVLYIKSCKKINNKVTKVLNFISDLVAPKAELKLAA
jgi:hypothetical protein